MKINNRTHYDTKSIAALIRRVAQDELQSGQLKRAKVTVRWSRRRYSGWCFYGNMKHPDVRMLLRLPHRGPIDSVDVAALVAHELAHAKGIRHQDMGNVRYGWKDGWRELYAYAVNFPITERTKTPTSKSDAIAKKIERAAKMVARWRTRVKRSTTQLKKWERRQSYYSKKKEAGN